MCQEQYRQVFNQRQCANTRHTVIEYEKLSKPNAGQQGHTRRSFKARFWPQQESSPMLVLTEERITSFLYLGFTFSRRPPNRRAILAVVG